MTYKCNQCGRDNAFVNQCGCDPNNLPTRVLPAGIDAVTIEPSEPGYFDVYGHGEYEEHSVLAGQYRRVYLDTFDSVAAARAAYPLAELLDHRTSSTAQVPSSPWQGFSEGDAGERWDEDY